MPFENAIFGVKNTILGIADLIKPCDQADKLFIKNKPEQWLFPEQRVWCRYKNFNPILNPKPSNAKVALEL